MRTLDDEIKQFNPALQKKIIKESVQTGKPFREVAAEYVMPKLVIDDEDEAQKLEQAGLKVVRISVNK
jgi:adenine C2-methylase RlmN of 23S rRNA A2503 and tRNA A37